MCIRDSHQSLSIATDPCCHDNEILDKIVYNSAYVKDIAEIFASNGGYSSRAIQWCHLNLRMTNCGCYGKEIWDKIGYKLITDQIA